MNHVQNFVLTFLKKGLLVTVWHKQDSGAAPRNTSYARKQNLWAGAKAQRQQWRQHFLFCCQDMRPWQTMALKPPSEISIHQYSSPNTPSISPNKINKDWMVAWFSPVLVMIFHPTMIFSMIIPYHPHVTKKVAIITGATRGIGKAGDPNDAMAKMGENWWMHGIWTTGIWDDLRSLLPYFLSKVTSCTSCNTDCSGTEPWCSMLVLSTMLKLQSGRFAAKLASFMKLRTIECFVAHFLTWQN